ncbi:MAG: methylenetetrahydrofolate reductase C-terminal domain-containing protein [Anaerolineae bacterium]
MADRIDLSKYQQSLLDPATFSVSWELVPGRGSFEKAQEEVVRAAKEAAQDGRIHALTLTDNPGGNPAISAEMLGAEITQLGIEPLVHFTCKDKNRNQLEALLYGLERATVRNFLVMSGDYTYTGYRGRSKPVFDLDPTQLLGLISALNAGMEVPLLSRSAVLARAHLFAGAVVSPFKALESEQMSQYYKLRKKLNAGAQFIVTQLGYDARKFHEALSMMQRLGYGDVPLVANIYLLTPPVARLMNRNAMPGCVVTDRLVADVEAQGTSRQEARAASLERAASMYAFTKGMGFAGAHIGGHGLRYEDIAWIIERGEQLAPSWLDIAHTFDYPQPNGWYYFERDPETGLNSEAPVDRSGHRPPATLGYRAFRALGKAMFNPKGALFKPLRAASTRIDGSRLERPFTRMEHITKVITSECLNCGDCALQDAAYLCVTSQCPKGERNGPCGGSFQGWCEVYPGKKRCIYVRAYERLKHYGEEDSLAAYQVPPLNYDLMWTSSWLNFSLGRDHTAKRLGIEPPPKVR